MARTPKNSPRTSRASPATVGKITKKNNNLLVNLKVESTGSKSLVSSICTPRRMTRSFAKATHEEMPPPASPLHTKKRKVNKSTKKSPSAGKQENETDKSVRKDRNSMKLFAEKVTTESNSEGELPSAGMLGQSKTPVVENKPLEKQSSGKKGRKLKRSNAIEAESKLDTTFEMETENQENNKETDLPSAGKKAPIKNRISVIDLTESPVVKKSSPMNTTFSPLANILEESDAGLNEETFIEKNISFPEPKIQIVITAPTPKSAEKVSIKAVKKSAPQLKRLQAKTPMKAISEGKAKTPISGILKQKPMSSAKKVKVLEAAKVFIAETITSKPIGSAKKAPLKSGEKDAQKSSPFRFGAPENKSRGFNFNLIGSKIPTFKELEKKKEQAKATKSGKLKNAINNITIPVSLKSDYFCSDEIGQKSSSRLQDNS